MTLFLFYYSLLFLLYLQENAYFALVRFATKWILQDGPFRGYQVTRVFFPSSIPCLHINFSVYIPKVALMNVEPYVSLTHMLPTNCVTNSTFVGIVTSYNLCR